MLKFFILLIFLLVIFIVFLKKDLSEKEAIIKKIEKDAKETSEYKQLLIKYNAAEEIKKLCENFMEEHKKIDNELREIMHRQSSEIWRLINKYERK